MKIAISELEHLRQEVMKNYQIIEEMQKKRPWVGLTKEAVELNEPVISAWSLR